MSARLILQYNRPWPEMLYGDIHLPDCACNAKFTTDTRLFWKANAVIFHIPNLYTLPSPRKQWWHKLSRQQWVAWSMESILYYPKQVAHDFMSQFEITMTYRRDSTIWYPYFDPGVLEPMLRPPQPKPEKALASYFASNANALSGRDAYVTELMQYIPIDSFGRVMRNRTLPRDVGMVTKIDTIMRYKFHLAFENSITEDYVSEKFYHPLMIGTVPIYLGAPNIEDFAPADYCYINAAQYKPKELAEYLLYLDAHAEAYNEYFAWKSPDKIRGSFLELLEKTKIHPFCKLCKLIAQTG
jgi:hypothetical protein